MGDGSDPEAAKGADGKPADEPHDAVSRALLAEFGALSAQPISAGLYLVATPIGHLGDISLRALHLIANSDTVYCEDTRTSQRLTSRFGIRRHLRAYHEHSDATARETILSALEGGQSITLISDAGTPGISDPGFKLVRAAVDAGHTVYSVPGPVAFVSALTVSGLPTDRFLFAGFLSAKRAQRRRQLAAFEEAGFSVCLYESPNRLTALLSDAADVLGGTRPAAVARELTKRFEEVQRGTLEELAAWSSDATVRGEVAVVIGPSAPKAEAVTDADIAARLAEADPNLSASRAAKAVAEALGVPKSRVYAVGLEHKKD